MWLTVAYFEKRFILVILINAQPVIIEGINYILATLGWVIRSNKILSSNGLKKAQWALNDTNCTVHIYVFLSCIHDYLELRDGSTLNADLISKLCGDTRPSTQHSTGSSLLLRFRTDMSVTHKGFKARYSIGKWITCIPNNVNMVHNHIHFKLNGLTTSF